MIAITVTHRIRHNTRSEQEYRERISQLVRELELHGPLLTHRDYFEYPILARATGWQLRVGVPVDRQEYYVEFDRAEAASFYMLKHGGDGVEGVG